MNGTLLDIDTEPMPCLPQAQVGNLALCSCAQDCVGCVSLNDNFIEISMM